MIQDNFLDIIKHTSSLGFIDMVKLTGTTDGVKVEAIDDERSVVVAGNLRTPIEGLNGTIGLGRIGVLSGYLNFAPFVGEEAIVSIGTKELADGSLAPSQLDFNSNNGHMASYRFMSSEIANDQIRVPPFKGATWDVIIEPTKAALRDLNSMNSILSAYEALFSVKTNGTNLEFNIGESNSDNSRLVFAKDISGKLTHAWSWQLSKVIGILKLHASSEKCTMKFSNQGALLIEIDSGLGVYEYILPAKVK